MSCGRDSGCCNREDYDENRLGDGSEEPIPVCGATGEEGTPLKKMPVEDKAGCVSDINYSGDRLFVPAYCM